MQTQTKIGTDFTRAALPWIVMIVALVVYGITLNRWVSIGSLAQMGALAGWDWQPTVVGPLNYLLTFPIRWLNPAWQPVALNAFSAICAALSLALLARSVSLMPHDRTREQRYRDQGEYGLLCIPSAWVPPVLAVLVLGLQFTFWDNAVTGTGEMLDLLLFAYVVRCLLEYRLGEKESWLFKGTFVYGLAITSNWAMIGFFPLYLIALIWTTGNAFFRFNFLAKLTALFCAGLLLYLLLPIITVASNYDGVTFWSALKGNLSHQKFYLLFRGFRWPVFLLSMTSLVPLCLIALKWPSFMGDVSPIANLFSDIAFRVVHLTFLVAGVWVIYQPPYARALDTMPLRFLPFFYLTALCIGYIFGYFLLIFQPQRNRSSEHPWALMSVLGRVLVVATWICLLALPALFLQRNLPRIMADNGPWLKQFARQMAESLPSKGAVVLSDDPVRLYLLETYYRGEGKNPHVLVNTGSLVYNGYHRHLAKVYPGRWVAPAKPLPEPIDSMELIQYLANVSRLTDLYYLHPSFGYYFEYFYPVPHGLAYALKPYPTGVMTVPPLLPETIQENQAFWQKTDQESLTVLPKLRAAKSLAAQALCGFYSRALNYWGVELQRNNRLNEALPCFTRAISLNPENEVAKLNLAFNTRLRTGKNEMMRFSSSLWDRFTYFRSPDAIMGANGPFDDPAYCMVTGLLFARTGNNRQAVTLFSRVKTAHPDNIEGDIMLGNVYLQVGMADRTLDLVKQARTPGTSKRWLELTNQIELIQLEALAQYARKDDVAAERVLQTALAAHPDSESMLSMATQVYLMRGSYTNALAMIDRLLKINPDNLNALLSKGALSIQINHPELAIVPLTRVLDRQVANNAARMNRAIALLQTGQLDAARKDYDRLLDNFPKLHTIRYGLGEVAYRRKENAEALKQYEAYIKYAPTNTIEFQTVSDRVKQLKKS